MNPMSYYLQIIPLTESVMMMMVMMMVMVMVMVMVTLMMTMMMVVLLMMCSDGVVTRCLSVVTGIRYTYRYDLLFALL